MTWEEDESDLPPAAAPLAASAETPGEVMTPPPAIVRETPSPPPLADGHATLTPPPASGRATLTPPPASGRATLTPPASGPATSTPPPANGTPSESADVIMAPSPASTVDSSCFG